MEPRISSAYIDSRSDFSRDRPKWNRHKTAVKLDPAFSKAMEGFIKEPSDRKKEKAAREAIKERKAERLKTARIM